MVHGPAEGSNAHCSTPDGATNVDDHGRAGRRYEGTGRRSRRLGRRHRSRRQRGGGAERGAGDHQDEARASSAGETGGAKAASQQHDRCRRRLARSGLAEGRAIRTRIGSTAEACETKPSSSSIAGCCAIPVASGCGRCEAVSRGRQGCGTDPRDACRGSSFPRRRGQARTSRNSANPPDGTFGRDTVAACGAGAQVDPSAASASASRGQDTIDSTWRSRFRARPLG
jgi:hypothetical protein